MLVAGGPARHDGEELVVREGLRQAGVGPGASGSFEKLRLLARSEQHRQRRLARRASFGKELEAIAVGQQQGHNHLEGMAMGADR